MSTYKGETLAKKAVRICKWLGTKKLQGEKFKQNSHLFLSSKVGGDISSLRALSVPYNKIYPTDIDLEEMLLVSDIMEKKGMHPFEGCDISNVVEGLPEVLSVYLDYTGTCKTYCRDFQEKDIANTTKRVVSCVDKGGVVTLTHTRSRDGMSSDEHRRHVITSFVSQHSSYKVTPYEYIQYFSKDLITGKGSPMFTMSFYMGKCDILPDIILTPEQCGNENYLNSFIDAKLIQHGHYRNKAAFMKTEF